MATSSAALQKIRLAKKFEAFRSFSTSLFQEIRKDVLTDSVLDKLLIKRQILTANDTLHQQEPESFTKEKLIERLLQFLGYDVDALRREIGLKVQDERKRDADYKLLVRTQFILLEAEPLNKDLEAPKSGASQVREWLSSKFAQTDYGIATDGFRWKLLKVSQKTRTIPTVFEIDLSPFFSGNLLKQLGQADNDLKILFNKFYFYFSRETILNALSGETIETLEKETEVTSLFYRKYIKYIFGIDRGARLSNCLLNRITNNNPGSSEQDKRLFSVITMNRLIFVKFLQDKNIISRSFLTDLIDEHKRSPNNPNSFYHTYLKSLFYDIFSKPLPARKQIKGSTIFNVIPYLNGGLFMETVSFEREFDIDNDILFEIIGQEFLSAFNLTYYADGDVNRVNPDILGRVFEKTINYITSRMDFSKKEQGAYYTPTEVTNYLCEKTIKQYLFEKSLRKMEELGTSKQKLALLKDYDDMLRVLPEDVLVLEELQRIVQNIKVLDPACGSGHFLKDAADLLLRINHVFYSKLQQKHSNHHLLKSIIVNNLFGVDIDANAVEIAKLRMWMALIDSADEDEKLEALPNIEYNIRQGNSLVGFVDLLKDSSNISDYVELDITDKIDLLATNYQDKAETLRDLARRPNVSNMTKIKDILVNIYKNENLPELRNVLKVLIEQVLGAIKVRTTELYIAYVHNKAGTEGKQIYRDRLLLLKPFQWVTEYGEILADGGFDVIIENPPYDVLSPKDREFFGDYHREFRILDKKEQNKIKRDLLKDPVIQARFKQYQDAFKTYQVLLKFLPEYHLQTNVLNGKKWKRSDPNYYRFFIERSNQLLKPDGRLGMICPKGFIGELGSTALRLSFITSYSDFEFREFNNRTEDELIFEDVDPNFRFVIFSYWKKEASTDPVVAYCYCSKLEDIRRPYATYERNKLSFFLRLNSELCILQWIRSSIEFTILEKISKFPKMNDQVGFKLRSTRELDTTEVDKFTDKPTEIPLWEGSLVGHFVNKQEPLQYVLPEKFQPTEDFFKRRIVIRRILPNSVRKFYSTIIPPKVAVGGSLMYIIPEQTYEEQCYVVALLNSLLIEYRGKQLLSKMTLNQYVLDILPIPRTRNSRTVRISKLAQSLTEGQVSESQWDTVMRQIDAEVFKLFGLNTIEIKLILDTFRISREEKSEILELMKSN